LGQCDFFQIQSELGTHYNFEAFKIIPFEMTVRKLLFLGVFAVEMSKMIPVPDRLCPRPILPAEVSNLKDVLRNERPETYSNLFFAVVYSGLINENLKAHLEMKNLKATPLGGLSENKIRIYIIRS
jgi:hypothetical protein